MPENKALDGSNALNILYRLVLLARDRDAIEWEANRLLRDATNLLEGLGFDMDSEETQ